MLAKEALKRLPPNPSGHVVLGQPEPRRPGARLAREGHRGHVRREGARDTDSRARSRRSATRARATTRGRAGAGQPERGRVPRRRRRRQLRPGPDQASRRRHLPDGGLRPRRQTLQAVKDGTNFVTISPEHFLKGTSRSALLADGASRTARRCRRAGSTCRAWSSTRSNVDEIIERQASQEAAARRRSGPRRGRSSRDIGSPHPAVWPRPADRGCRRRASRKRYGGVTALRRRGTSAASRARCTRCSGRTAPASPRWSRSSPALERPGRGQDQARRRGRRARGRR